MASLQLRVLGPVEVIEDGRPLTMGSSKQRSLLAFLLIHANEVQSTDRIIDAIWGDEPPQGGVKTLRYHVSKLRSTLGVHGDVIVTRSPGYVLNVPPELVDQRCFEQFVTEARSVLSSDPRRASRLLTEALGLWRGRPYSDFQYGEFVQAEARRLDEMRLAAVEDRIRADLAAGQHRALIGELEGLVEEYPLRERLWALLMVALYRAGRQADALREYGTLRKRLVEQLGLDPSPQLQALEQRILEQDPSLASSDPFAEVVAPARTEVRNPYKGLRPFNEADAGDFYGRADLVGRIVERLGEPGVAGQFLVLTGPSGSGKSSVVRAGLIPALRRGAVAGSHGWRVVQMYPGGDPVTRLEEALEGGNGDMLLMIDQFEELFVLADEQVQAAFLDMIYKAVADDRALRVIITLRADFLDRALRHPGFARLMDAGLMLVTPLLDDEVRAAAVEPAAAAGVRVEPELVAQMVSDVHSRAATLPLLQYALTDLFEHRRGDELTLLAYRAAGGISGALARRADQIHEELDPAEREAARQLFLRLVTVTPDAEHLRRRVPRTELADLPIDQDALTRVLDRFGRQRLLTFDRDVDTAESTVEVAHEALLREWPRLWQWVETNRHDIRTHRHLAAALTEWAEANHDPEFLPTGNRLSQLQTFAADTTLVLSAVEQEYLDAAVARAADQQGLASRRRRRVVAALSMAAVIAAVFAVVALLQRNRAEDEAARAEQQAALAQEQTALAEEQAAVAQEQTALAEQQTAVAQDQTALAEQQVRITTARELAGAARANMSQDPELSMLLALEAIGATRAAGEPIVGEAIGSLHEAVLASRWSRTLPGSGEPVWSPDGSKLATFKPGSFETLLVLDAATGETIHELTGLVDASDMAWSPDGRLIATTDDHGPTILWDATTGERLPPLADTMTDQKTPTFSSEGALLAARSGRDASVTVVDTASGEEVTHIPYVLPRGIGLSFSPDQELLAIAAWDEAGPEGDGIELRALPGGEEIGMMGPHPGVTQMVFSPDGDRLASVSRFGGIRIWEVETGSQLLDIPDGGAGEPAWSPDGSTIAVVRTDGAIEFWDPTTGLLADTLTGHDSTVFGLAFSPDGSMLATSDFQKTRIWNLTSLGGEIATFPGVWFGSAWMPDGSLVATDFDGPVHLLNVATAEVIASYRGSLKPGFPRVIVSPDGRFVATADTDGAIVLDAATLLRVESTAPWLPLDFSPDAGLLAVGQADGEFFVFRLYDTKAWKEVAQVEFGAVWAAFLPDGRHVVISTEGTAPMLWDLEAGVDVARLPLPDQGWGGGVSVTADGALVAIGENQSGYVGVWRVDALLGGATNDEALIREFDGPPGLNGALLSPDGSLLFAGGFGGILDVFDVDTGNRAYAIDFGDPLGEFSLSSDGRYLAVPTGNGLHVVTTDIDELIAIAESRIARNLTNIECQTFLHAESCPAG